MDYKKAYEELSKALWRYDKSLSDAYTRLMQEVRIIDSGLDNCTSPTLYLFERAEKE